MKKFVCHHSAFNKIDRDKNKKGVSKNFGCCATITAKIKLNTLVTRKKDSYVKKGLVGIITVNKLHNHSLQTDETLWLLPADQHIKVKFYEYFSNSMGIAEASICNEGLLEKPGDSSDGVLASGRINPSKRTVRYWHGQWLENSEQQMDASLSGLEAEALLSELDERNDEAKLVTNESTMDEAENKNEEQEPSYSGVIKEEITVEETSYTGAEKDKLFASVWIKEEVDSEGPELENEDEEGEEEHKNEFVSLPAVTTVVKEEATIDDTENRQCELISEQSDFSTYSEDMSSTKTLQKNGKLDVREKSSSKSTTTRTINKECDVCYKVFKSYDGLIRHKFAHSGVRKYECDMCNKNFSSASNLAGHKLVHSNIKKHKCHACDKSFKTFRALKVHKLTHGTDKNYKCDICEKAFRLPSTLSQHKSNHIEVKQYQCGVCNKAFSYLHLLTRHEIVHSGIKNYHCDVCNKPFSRRYEMARHKAVHSGVKKYQCDICFKLFAQAGSLSIHKLTHSGERNYQCDICNKTYVSLRNLKRHKEIHSYGAKRYQCDVCDRAFNWSTGLSVHKLTHTGVTYQCDICNKILSNASNLSRHRLMKHIDGGIILNSV